MNRTRPPRSRYVLPQSGNGIQPIVAVTKERLRWVAGPHSFNAEGVATVTSPLTPGILLTMIDKRQSSNRPACVVAQKPACPATTFRYPQTRENRASKHCCASAWLPDFTGRGDKYLGEVTQELHRVLRKTKQYFVVVSCRLENVDIVKL
jgi:hypothetical protein